MDVQQIIREARENEIECPKRVKFVLDRYSIRHHKEKKV